jgi:copper chaperone CopZ
MTQQKIQIEGMHCNACVRRVTLALTKLDGVDVHSVEIGSAQLQIDETKVSPKEVAAAIEAIGFKVKA